MVSSVSSNPCNTAVINLQPPWNPGPVQLNCGMSLPFTFFLFPLHTDSVGTCGVKTYSVPVTWLSFTTTSTDGSISLTLNDPNQLPGPYSIAVTVGFTLYPQTVSQPLNFDILSPCMLTSISTSQTIGPIDYMFGSPASLTPFTEFSDTQSDCYLIPGLCQLNYQIIPNTWTSIINGDLINAILPQISVFTNDPLAKGASGLTYKLVANTTPQQNLPCPPLTFFVNIIDTCKAFFGNYILFPN